MRPATASEPLAHAFDDGTEREVVESIQRLNGGGKTVFIFPYRLATLRHSDRISRLQGGETLGVYPCPELEQARLKS